MRDTRAAMDERDLRAEHWLLDQHDHDWYIGDATTSEWERAYLAVDAAMAARASEEHTE